VGNSKPTSPWLPVLVPAPFFLPDYFFPLLTHLRARWCAFFRLD
jgi:hypothetical protein